MFNNFKLRIGNSRLRKQLKTFTRHKQVQNFVSASEVGIVFYATTTSTFKQVFELTDYLTGKNIAVSIIAYCPLKEIPEEFMQYDSVNLFCRKDLNWFGKPVAPFVDEFMRSNLDILIDLSTEEIFPLKWLVAQSKAKFRVGNLNYPDNPNDLIINVKPNQDLSYLISQIKHYLNLINNSAAQKGFTED